MEAVIYLLIFLYYYSIIVGGFSISLWRGILNKYFIKLIGVSGVFPKVNIVYNAVINA